MNKDEAVLEVEHLGYAYFYDQVGDLADEEILATIQQDVQLTQLGGLYWWEEIRDALQVVLTESSEQESDEILRYYGHVAAEVGGSHHFLSTVYRIRVFHNSRPEESAH